MGVPVWTSTQNKEDRDSEQAHLKSLKQFTVAMTDAKLAALNPDTMTLKSVNAISKVRLPAEWMTNHVQKAVALCVGSLSPDLRNIRIEVSEGKVRTYAMSPKSAICFTTDVTTQTEQEEVLPFAINISAEEMQGIWEFLKKSYISNVHSKETGKSVPVASYEIGVRSTDPQGLSDAMLLACFTPESDNGFSNRRPGDVSAAKQKVAVFKLNRSIGELPVHTYLQDIRFIKEFTTTVSHALKWVFAKEHEYIEFFTSPNGLSVRYVDNGYKVSTNLGARLTSNCKEDATGGTALVACMSGPDLKYVFNLADSPIQMKFGTIMDDGGNEQLSMAQFKSNDFIMSIAQAYPQELEAEFEKYITRKGGKIVDSTEEESKQRAEKQNKGIGGTENPTPKEVSGRANALETGVEETLPPKVPTEVTITREGTPEVKGVTLTFNEALTHDLKTVSEVKEAEKEVTIDGAELEQIFEELAPEMGVSIADREGKMSIERLLPLLMENQKHHIDALEDLLQVVSDLRTEAIKTNTCLYRLTGVVNTVPTEDSNRYGSDILAKVLEQFKGQEVTNAVLSEYVPKELLKNLPQRMGHLMKMQLTLKGPRRGVYLIPEDFTERFQKYISVRFNKGKKKTLDLGNPITETGSMKEIDPPDVPEKDMAEGESIL